MSLHAPGKTRGRKGMEPVYGGKCFPVEGQPGLPAGQPERPEVRIAEVFDDDQTGGGVVADYAGHRYPDACEECRNVRIVGVFHALRVIMDQDGRASPVPLHTEIGPVGPPFPKGGKRDGDGRRELQGLPAKRDHGSSGLTQSPFPKRRPPARPTGARRHHPCLYRSTRLRPPRDPLPIRVFPRCVLIRRG